MVHCGGRPILEPLGDGFMDADGGDDMADTMSCDQDLWR